MLQHTLQGSEKKFLICKSAYETQDQPQTFANIHSDGTWMVHTCHIQTEHKYNVKGARQQSQVLQRLNSAFEQKQLHKITTAIH